ncbi:MAG: peptidoglycan DD-metalloendopeptidase family protein [Actinomycetota bacterium]|nr:peptidoglycan DD-metalloendopeptidase family protein [Actinomycetota bacterium]
MKLRLTRRSVIYGALAAPIVARVPPARTERAMAFALPIGLPDRIPGDGFVVRHGYACENTWYNPGWLHTGEDWYVSEGDSAGALIYAVAAGEVVFAGSEYPGHVVIVRHAADLYSMYGHLDYELAVETGEPVKRGQTLGTVLARTDGRAPSHLHFEIRTFLTTPEVNGNSPRYAYGCGFECPPGPGYWPMNAPEHPSAMGWRNPTHVIARRAFDDSFADAEVVVPESPGETASLWSAPEGINGAQRVGDLRLRAGDRYGLLAIEAGREATTETGAEGYRLWYRIALPGGERAWVLAAAPSTVETGSDGRPSSVRFDFLPTFAVPKA